MEAVKLAFETVIVGLFALPWLWVMIDLLNPNVFHSLGIRRMAAYVPAELRTPAIGITLFSLVYLLGSMITPVAHEFFNDPDMLGQFLPTDEKIQAYNFKHVGGTTGSDRPLQAKFEPINSRDANAAAEEAESVTDKFEREQSAVLLHGPDSSERLNRLHEQLIVLRGAAFSAFALMVLCGFAWCGRYNTEGVVAGEKSFLRQQLRCSIALVISSAFILLAGRSLIIDLHSLQSGDMPIAEIVLLVLGGFGLYIAIGGTRSRLKFHGVMCVFAFCFTLLCYTGYGCTERSYDQELFYTYQALTPAAGAENVHAVTRPGAMTASINE